MLTHTEYEHLLISGRSKTLCGFAARLLDLPPLGRLHGLEKCLDGAFREEAIRQLRNNRHFSLHLIGQRLNSFS